MELQVQYIYLLKEREFVNTKENVYKVGKTKQVNHKRLNQYPKGSILLLQIVCGNCDTNEQTICKLFQKKYKQRKDIGSEYFEGNYHLMINDICTTVSNEDPKNPESIKKHSNVRTCECCNFSTKYKNVFDNHNKSKRHLINQNKPIDVENMVLFDCLQCKKSYTSRSGLWRHMQTCTEILL